jgi:hypothetical protein
MAKPMPELWSAPFEAIMVLMPITSPREFSSGPPELPGLMAASVWIASSIGAPSEPRMSRMELMMPRVMVPLRPKGIADGIDLLPHRQLARVGQRHRLQVGRVDLQQRQVVHLVRAHHLGRIAALVAQHHLDAAVGALHHVEVGQHVAGLVENESRTLPCCGTVP